MTYIDIVNKILRRLRERTVETVNETEYSRLIGILVNDAKHLVEDSWQWSHLQTTLTATTQVGVTSYELQQAGTRFTMIDVINDTANTVMQSKPTTWFNRMFTTVPVQSGNPMFYDINGTSSDGDALVDLFPVPDAAYTIRFNMILRLPELANDADIIEIPYFPVEHLAYALAVEERGEDGGNLSAAAFAKANASLSDAIALDSGLNPERVDWVVA